MAARRHAACPGEEHSARWPSVLLVDPFGRTRDYDEALYASLKESGQRVRLLTTEFNEKRDVEGLGEGFFLRGVAYLQRQVPALPTRLLKALGALEYPLDLIRVTVAAKRHRAILHWQWVPFGPLTLTVVRAARAGPNIVTAHNIIPHDFRKGRVTDRLERLKYRWADRVVVHSARLRDELIRFCPTAAAKVTVIPAGLQHESIEPAPPRSVKDGLGIPEDVLLMGFLGLVRPYKGVADLLDAWRRLIGESGEHVRGRGRLVIAGDWALSGEEDRLALERARFADPGLIVLEGYLPEQQYADLLNALDLLVLPYRRASQSGVALGALRFGVPLLVTDSGGFPDLMPGELVDWMVAPNDPMALEERMLRFLDMSGDERDALRATVAQWAIRFSWRNISSSYDSLYAEVARR